MVLDKIVVRDKFRRLREAQSREEKNQADLALHKRVKNFLAEFGPVNAMAYRPLKSEANPSFGEFKQKFAYPKVISEGLMEARSELDVRIQPQELDLIFVPGVAFDRQGRRLGFGQGFYDRYLKNTHASRVGIAYAFQVSSEELPSQEWDERVDWILTDAFVLHVERKDERKWNR